MKNAYEMSMLFDFYGDTLTEKQQSYFDLYYNQDLSLGEIAENEGITRQGVRDVIVRAEAIMHELEEKTGIMARFIQVQKILENIDAAVDRIREINNHAGHSYEIETLTASIKSMVGEIKEQ